MKWRRTEIFGGKSWDGDSNIRIPTLSCRDGKCSLLHRPFQPCFISSFMSATPTTAKQPKAKKDKEKTASQVHQNERLKTVVRRLPPNLPEEIFWQSVQPWVTEETTIWKTYYKGKLRKKLNKENIPSRAYIAFKDPEQLALFSREYDGHTFRDKSGVESQAVVEYAPFPKIPSEKKKVDNRSGTIEKDEDFISFMESLKTPSTTGPVSLEALIASTRPASPPKTTPLLEALKAEKSANKDKEAILRNHAHYNQIMVPSSRKEEKKKASGPPASSRPVETPASTASNVQPKKSGKKGQPPPAASQPAPPPNPKAAPGSQKGAPNTTGRRKASQSTSTPSGCTAA
ncbi:unnamed protein product [Cyclocybe aegerita]|uniref:UPF3 domain-containing protein n=1 Tax=Cyclocybe aegerita TaxID=1973307 RepID=A0A8S0W7S4_CYCAE|nr:unnamed protein product [Cyclocybe aegerita]